MVATLVHPLLSNARDDRSRSIFDRVIKSKGMGDLWSDIGGTITDGITGLTEALGHALEKTAQIIGKIGETIALIVRACIGDVSWDKVLGELGSIFHDVGAIMVYLDPAHQSYEWLSQAPLTAHAFHELDKFTGGWLTTATNLSTLPGRVLRGDPISTSELIKDALLVIEIIVVIYTGPVGLGIVMGTMVGKEVCKHQTEYKDACMVAFQIVGAAAGGWAGALTGTTWGAATESATFSEAEENAWLNGDEAYANYLSDQAQQAALSQSTNFLDHLSAAGENYLMKRGVDTVTQAAIHECQKGKWVGANECRILGEVAGDYVKAPAGTDWAEFVGQEVARIGAEQIMMQWFPDTSPEWQAIHRQWQIKYIDVPVDQTVVIENKLDPKTLLLGAGAIFLIFAGGST